jgi:hypothetical protein
MTLEDVFLTNRTLRPIWRCFLSIVLVLFAHAAANLAAGALQEVVPWIAAKYALYFLFELAALLGAFKIMTRIFERKPLGVVGLAFHPAWVRELCVGLGIGALMMALVGVAEALLAVTRFAPSPLTATSELAYGGGLFLILFISATNEELVFRGYPFQKLVESLGPTGAVALASVCFGLVHLGNPDHTLFSTINTMLVGVPLSIAYLRTRALWMPVGIHFAWNYVQGFVFGLPVSGFRFPATLLNPRVHGGEWLTGSAYGPEGGLLCTIVVVGAGIFLFLSPRVRMSGKMKELVYGPSPYTAATPELHISPERGPGEEGPG